MSGRVIPHPFFISQSNEMTRLYVCLVCGNEAHVGAVILAEGVINWPHCYCATCPGNPEMAHPNR